MSTHHTPEPWKFGLNKKAEPVIINKTLDYDICVRGENNPNATLDIDRIVKCVNALEGIDNPSKLVEEYKLLQPILLDLLSIWDKGNSVVANCVYPNAIRFTLGLKPQPPIIFSIRCKVCGSRHQKHYAFCPHCSAENKN